MTDNPFSTQKQSSILLCLLITFFLLSTTRVNASVRFTVTNFTASTLAGDAEALNGGDTLELTNRVDNLPGTGRLVRNFKLDMWDDATGEYGSFATTFSFMFGSYGQSTEGFVFFIEPQGEQILPDNSGGGNLGVVDAYKGLNQFVAVEFDPYSDEWDPSYGHIGINVNSIISLKTSRWDGWKTGGMNHVTVAYDGASKILSVIATDNVTVNVFTLAQVIDLKAVLPQKIRLGFSATSKGSNLPGRNTLYAPWTFTRTLPVDEPNNIASYA